VEGLHRLALALAATLELTLDDQRARELERKWDRGQVCERAVEAVERGLRVASGGVDQGAAAGGCQLRPRPMQGTGAIVQLLGQAFCALELAEVDERLDRVGDDNRLA